MEVSVIIVSMNNYEVLSRCLDSIRTHTSTSYEVFVVAYLFSPENLQHLRQNYPWAQINESNEIRGFSANNNLALRKATGKYCFVLNDDTKIESDEFGGDVRPITIGGCCRQSKIAICRPLASILRPT